MRSFRLTIYLLLTCVNSVAGASSFLDIHGNLVDPIQTISGQAHSYSGPTLDPFSNSNPLELMGIDLSYANLAGADLRNTNLSGSDLTGADLRGADLRFTNLRGVNLEGANLGSAILRHANLRGASLSNTNLVGADLSSLTFLSTTGGNALYSLTTNLNDTWADSGQVPFSAPANEWVLTPEPSTGFLLGLGLLGLAQWRSGRLARS